MIEEYFKIVKKFIEAYNSMNLTAMLSYLHNDIEFTNISNGEVNTQTNGMSEFIQLAEQSLSYFTEREQRIVSYKIEGDSVLFEIQYRAVLAIDFPDGLKKGDTLQLNGHSKYKFKDEKIISIVDES